MNEKMSTTGECKMDGNIGTDHDVNNNSQNAGNDDVGYIDYTKLDDDDDVSLASVRYYHKGSQEIMEIGFPDRVIAMATAQGTPIEVTTDFVRELCPLYRGFSSAMSQVYPNIPKSDAKWLFDKYIFLKAISDRPEIQIRKDLKDELKSTAGSYEKLIRFPAKLDLNFWGTDGAHYYMSIYINLVSKSMYNPSLSRTPPGASSSGASSPGREMKVSVKISTIDDGKKVDDPLPPQTTTC